MAVKDNATVFSAEETRLLDEVVDLDEARKRYLLQARRAVRLGKSVELLGVELPSEVTEIKRAYRTLSRTFHPDRYFGKNLGSYKLILEEVFDGVTQAVRTLCDPRTVANLQNQRNRPRVCPRLLLACSARVRSPAWQEPLDVTTIDLSEGGVFLRSTESIDLGTEVVIALPLPSRECVNVRGRVRWRRTIADAMRLKRAPGFGLEFVHDGDSRTRLAALLLWAKQQQVQPADEPKQKICKSNNKPNRNPVVGIDLGTSYTSVSATFGNQVRLLPWQDGQYAMPSVIGFPSPGQMLLGAAAKQRGLRDPAHTIRSLKRLLGKRHDDQEIAPYVADVALDLREGPDGFVVVDAWHEQYSIVQLCSYLLREARLAAERALETRVEQAVLTVPVCFTLSQIALLKRAGELAQLEILDILREPTAAAMAYRHQPGFGGLVGVFDFGGGTFDFSVVEAIPEDVRVIVTGGDSWLGGDDLDLALANAVSDLVWQAKHIELRNRLAEWQVLLAAAEKSKCELSNRTSSIITVPEAFYSHAGAQDLRATINRQQAETLWQPAIQRALTTCQNTLAIRGMRPSDLSQVYFSGGTSYIPAVRHAVQSTFRRALPTSIPPEFAVCMGAGVRAAAIERTRL